MESKILLYTTLIILNIAWFPPTLPGQVVGSHPLNETRVVDASYASSWAIVIGVDKYSSNGIPALRHAVLDAKAVADMLIENQGFEGARVLQLYDADATREIIVAAFQEAIHKTATNDRLFFFFAGHGITMTQPTGREKGFILPFDANPNSYQMTCISTDQLNEFSEQIPAKHIYLVMDACYGGTIFTRGASLLPSETQNYFSAITGRRARQAITAGGRDQQVLDTGPGGHSVFTYNLIRGIREGFADLNHDSLITATELAAYVSPLVTTASNGYQTPEYGSIAGSEGGEFVFLRPGSIPSTVSISRPNTPSPAGQFDLSSQLALLKLTKLFFGGGYASYNFANDYVRDGTALMVEVTYPLGDVLLGLALTSETGKNETALTLSSGPTPVDFTERNIYVEALAGYRLLNRSEVSVAMQAGIGVAHFALAASFVPEQSFWGSAQSTTERDFLSLRLGGTFDYFPLSKIGVGGSVYYRIANSSAVSRIVDNVQGQPTVWDYLNQSGLRFSLGIALRLF